MSRNTAWESTATRMVRYTAAIGIGVNAKDSGCSSLQMAPLTKASSAGSVRNKTALKTIDHGLQRLAKKCNFAARKEILSGVAKHFYCKVSTLCYC